jgi:hypothetical protein
MNLIFLNKNDIESGLRRLGEIALLDSKLIDISVYGGSALVIAWDSRVSTRDVDAIVAGDAGFVRKATAQVAEENGWPADWLNDGVKGFISDRQEMMAHGVYPSIDSPGLRVYVPTAEYMLAMKCMAMRIGGADSSRDVEDIKFLVGECGLKKAEDVIAIVEKFYPQCLIQPKVVFGIEEIFEGMKSERKTEPSTPRPKDR